MYSFSNAHEKGFSKRHEAVVCVCGGGGGGSARSPFNCLDYIGE